MTPYDLLQRALRADAARPLVTFYDDATGERVELSVATYDNWVAKTANLLQDELAVEPGERVGFALPVHWQAAVVPMACWAVGALVVPISEDGGIPSGLGAAFVSADRLPTAQSAAPRELVALSLRPLGGRLDTNVTDGPTPVRDFSLEVPPQADRFAPYAPPRDTDAAWSEPTGSILSLADLVALASATDSGNAPTGDHRSGARVLSTRPLTTLPGIVAGLLAPLATTGSVVLCRNLDPERLDRRKADERVTAEVH